MEKKLVSLVLILLYRQVLFATIINIPDDQPTIQSGIDAAVNGDTILVKPNIYFENINFHGKNIIVASLFLTTQDTSYISQTIIDGNQSGSVVAFVSGEDSTTVLCGFTIYNGSGYIDYAGNFSGGGIYINNASPKIMNSIITGNTSNEGAGITCNNSNSTIIDNLIKNNNADPYWGGGIKCSSFGGVISNNIIVNNQASSGGGIEIYMDSNPQITNNIISNNIVSSMGGGLILYTRCNPIMKNNIICDNEANAGGAIFLHLDSNPAIINNTLCNNVATSGGSIYTRYHSHPTLINSILWNIASQEIYCNDAEGTNTITISYSDIIGGQSAITNGDIYWLDGNIDSDPLFINSDNGDYHLSESSPCIDAGDSSDVYNDLENPWNLGYALYPSLGGLRNDMGAYGGPYVAAPKKLFNILSVSNVPNDQGRKVRIQWTRHPDDDSNGDDSKITHYSIWRKHDPNLTLHKSFNTPVGEWDYIKDIPAVQDIVYSTIVPTLADSNKINGMYYSTFFVRAHTSDVSVHFVTEPDSGYSVDNLNPIQISGFRASLNEQYNVFLQWNESSDSDISHYVICRDTVNDFVPDVENNSIANVNDIHFVDENVDIGNSYYYIISAFDFNGNESDYSNPVSVNITGIDKESIPFTFNLHQNYPNPFNPSTTINFTLPKPSYVTLKIYSLLGKEIDTLVHERRETGEYTVEWASKDLPSGIYLYRLEAGEFVETRKLILQR